MSDRSAAGRSAASLASHAAPADWRTAHAPPAKKRIVESTVTDAHASGTHDNTLMHNSQGHGQDQQPAAGIDLGDPRAKVIALKLTDGTHIMGNMDLEDTKDNLTEYLQSKTQAFSHVAAWKEADALNFDILVTNRHGKTAIIVTFKHALIAKAFYDDFSGGGFAFNDTIAGQCNFTASMGYIYYEEAAPDEIPRGGMAIVIRGCPTARASADYYVNLIKQTFGDCDKHIINEHTWGGTTSGIGDGSITLVTTNPKGITAFPEVPTFLDGNIIGKHDFSRGQIAIMKHKVCKDGECRSIDGACIPSCKARILSNKMDENKEVAIKKAFVRKLDENKDQVQSLRGMFKKQAAAHGGLCMRYNKSGIPCYPCKFYPCEDWDNLMDTTLSNTIYKELPDALRRAA